jgi:hypothetical protein
VASVNESLSAFAVGPRHYDGGRLSMTQRLARAVADHRGRVEMPAYAVMVEAVTNGIFWSPHVDGPLTVVTAPDRIGKRLGTVSATMTGSAGVVFARATVSIRFH